MPQVRGLPADGVWRVPLLQGHEEVRRSRAHEAELHHAAVHRGECARAQKAQAGLLPAPGLPASLPACPALEVLCLRGVLGDSLSSYPWLHSGSLATLSDSCVVSGGL